MSIELSTLLTSGLAALNLTATESSKKQLLDLIALLIKWNRHISLTAITEPREILIRHIFDSLAIIPYLKGQEILDFGSGCGFPGLPLAIMLPEWQFVLLDSSHKKTTFLRQVQLQLGLTNVSIVTTRVEDYHSQKLFDTIVTRATVAAAEAERLLMPLARGQLLLMKGKNFETELAQLKKIFTVQRIMVPSLDEARHLIVLPV